MVDVRIVNETSPEANKIFFYEPTDRQTFGAGWDKIFYFVGANTFNKKFRLKQRESDATKDVQNSGDLGISSCDNFFLTVACGMKFVPVTGSFFL